MKEISSSSINSIQNDTFRPFDFYHMNSQKSSDISTSQLYNHPLDLSIKKTNID